MVLEVMVMVHMVSVLYHRWHMCLGCEKKASLLWCMMFHINVDLMGLFDPFVL